MNEKRTLEQHWNRFSQNKTTFKSLIRNIYVDKYSLHPNDEGFKILTKFEKNSDELKSLNWKEAKEKFDNYLNEKPKLKGIEKLKNKALEKIENENADEIKLINIIKDVAMIRAKAGDSNLKPAERSNLNNQAEEMIVDFLKEKYNVVTIRDDDRQGNYETFVYHEGIYKKDAISYLSEDIRKIFGQSYSSQKANNIISKIQVDTFQEADVFFKEQDIYKVPVMNGILNIKTKKLEKFNPKYRFFNKLPVAYNPEADCKKIKQFLRDIVKESFDVDLLQEMIGFSILRDYRYEKAFMLSGNGRNGKSKFLQLIKLLLGIENCSSISLQDIEKDNFSISNLQNKLVNIVGDISHEALTNKGKFKNLTGRDLIDANRKFKTNAKFLNYAKMFFSANELPRTYDLTEAFFLRWIIIDFPFKFVSKEEYNQAEDKSKLKIRNEKIIDEIASEEELSGLLNFALEGLCRLESKKDFTYSKQTEEIKKLWLRKSNSFNAFCMDCLEEDYDSYIVKQDLKTNYVKYCRSHKLKIASDKAIKNILSDTFGASEDRLSEGSRETIWRGISLISVKDVKDVKGILPYRQNNIISLIDEKPLTSMTSMTKENNVLDEKKKSVSEMYNEIGKKLLHDSDKILDEIPNVEVEDI